MIEVAIAKRGAGKTTLLKRRVVERAAELPRTVPVWLHDTRMGMEGDSGLWTLAHRAARLDTAGDLLQLLAGDHPPRCAVVGREPPDRLLALAVARAQAGKPTLLVIDELDQLCSDARKPGTLAYWTVHYGRVPGLDVLGSVRQLSDLPQAWLTQADALHLGRLSGAQANCAIAYGWMDKESKDKARNAPVGRFERIEP